MPHPSSIQDHVRRRNRPSLDNEVVNQQLRDLLSPAVHAQAAYYRQLGLRERILSLPLMVAAVLTLIWRQVPSVGELTRLLAREDLLWSKAVKVSQQAVSQRFLEFPCELFERVLQDLLPVLTERWQVRERRAIPESVKVALEQFERVWIVDGSTLEALFRKLASLQDHKPGALAGKIGVVLDLVRRFPVAVWFESNPYAHDTGFGERLVQVAPVKTLVILDRGFWDFGLFDALITQQVGFITRLKANAHWSHQHQLSRSAVHRDQLIRLGKGYKGNPILSLRLVELKVGSGWHTYLTSVTDPSVLPPFVVADLYCRRWRIEETFNTLKRLLGLSYLWTGSINGIKLQIWASWLFYAVLVDLADAVADELSVPFERISLEMLCRGLYHFSVAFAKGTALDPVAYFAAPENRDLDVLKALRKKPPKLDLSPFPSILTGTTLS